MAADWIKLRCELQSHPKVVRILSATGTDKFRVIGGLHAVWTVFDAHSQDGVLPGYTPDLMDHIIGWDGFSAAMISVGWLDFEEPETLVMPEFTEHNGQSAKRRAEDQKRKRNSRQSVRNVSAESPEKSGPEKRREDNKKNIQKKVELDYSSWPGMPSEQTLSDWLDMRKRKKAGVTQTVINRLGSKLYAATEKGFTVDECLAECVTRNWTGFDVAWIERDAPKQGGGFQC